MNSFDTIIDLLNHRGPGLQDYVTPDELDQLIAGTIAPAIIGDRYLADLADSSYSVRATETETRADLLLWIQGEIEIEIEERAEDAVLRVLEELADIAHEEKLAASETHRRKMTAVAEAQDKGATKGAIARNLGISRPTLDAWIRDRDDCALFNAATIALAKTGAGTTELINRIYSSLGTWTAKEQAETILAGAQRINGAELTPDDRALVHRAAERASELLQGRPRRPATKD